jgi:hypothetical protein
MTPSEAEDPANAQLLHDNVMDYYRKAKRVKPKFKIGQKVRILYSRTNFARAYDNIWQREIYEIIGVNMKKPIPMYELQTVYGDVEKVEGSFYANEMQPVTDTGTGAGVYKINKTLKEEYRGSGRSRRKWFFVSWLGYDKSHDSWIPASNVSKTYSS